MYETLRDLLYSNEFSVVERFEIPEQAARYAPIPRFLFDSGVGMHLKGRRQEETLWGIRLNRSKHSGTGTMPWCPPARVRQESRVPVARLP